jgi:DNA-binding response OmpR family regulator
MLCSRDSSVRILVVDDDERARQLFGGVLERGGYEYSLARDASQARAQLREHSFALVLADVHLPGESGLKLVQHVLGEYPNTAAVMISDADDPEIANIALECGAYGYIIKPYTANEVMIAVANALRRRRLEIENRLHRETLERIVHTRTPTLSRIATGSTAAHMHDVHMQALPDRLLLNLGEPASAAGAEMEPYMDVGRQIPIGSRHSGLLELATRLFDTFLGSMDEVLEVVSTYRKEHLNFNHDSGKEKRR